MDSLSRIPVAKFAATVGVSRNTAKRLFGCGVFPDEWVERSQGGKWFVHVNDERRSQAIASVVRWKIIRRRPNASRALPEPLSLEALALELFCLRLFGESSNIKNIQPLTRRFLSLSGRKIFNDCLEKLKGISNAPENHAVILIASKLIEFQTRYDGRSSATPQDLADLLLCSVASIYRHPYGRANIATARALIDRAMTPCSIHDLVDLDDRYGERLTPRRIRGHLLISLSRAEDLLAEFRLAQAEADAGDLNSSERYDFGGAADLSPFSLDLEVGTSLLGPGHSVNQTKKPRKLSAGELEVKQLKDRTRRTAETKFHLTWSLNPHGKGALFLLRVPTRATRIVAFYKNGQPPSSQTSSRTSKVPSPPSEKSYLRAQAQIDSRLIRLGCILPEAEAFCRTPFYFNGAIRDEHFSTLTAAIDDLLRPLKEHPDTQKLDPAPDWEALKAQAVDLWENRGFSSSSKT